MNLGGRSNKDDDCKERRRKNGVYRSQTMGFEKLVLMKFENWVLGDCDGRK